MNMLEYKYITITFLEFYNHSTVFVFTSYHFMLAENYFPENSILLTFFKLEPKNTMPIYQIKNVYRKH